MKGMQINLKVGKLSPQWARTLDLTIRETNFIAHREAVRNAPRGLTGNLERSIVAEIKKGKNIIDVIVFVPKDALARRYAKRLHDEKGKTWHKRGKGSIAKGKRADHLFIKRAVVDVANEFESRLHAIFKKLYG